jgi:hypothetical protein
MQTNHSIIVIRKCRDPRDVDLTNNPLARPFCKAKYDTKHTEFVYLSSHNWSV